MKNKVFIIVLLVICADIILNAGNFLIINEKPVRDEVIVVLGGDTIIRTDYSVKLFDEGYSNNLLFTGGDDQAVSMGYRAIKLGVPAKNIILENEAMSTYENAIFSKKIIMDEGLKNVMVVTSNYHMLRTSLVFDKAFKNTGIKLTFCSVQDKNFKPKWWFVNTYSRNTVVSEYAKLVGYFFEDRLI